VIESELSDIDFALRLADKADQITLSYYGQADLQVAQKSDATPVSEADNLVEQTLRALIAAELPGDGILGEEFGVTAGLGGSGGTAVAGRLTGSAVASASAGLAGAGATAGVGVLADPMPDAGVRAVGRHWIIDPIDGTKNFIRGVPVWATLIALAVDGDVMVGVVSAPALGRRWWAGIGHGAWTNGNGEPTPLHVSHVNNIADASLSYASLGGWQKFGMLDKLVALSLACGRSRAYGDFWSYMLVAEGAVDIAAEPELEVYDMAALVPIVTEAGGRFTSLAGQPGPWGGNALATNGLLHDAVLSRLTGQ